MKPWTFYTWKKYFFNNVGNEKKLNFFKWLPFYEISLNLNKNGLLPPHPPPTYKFNTFYQKIDFVSFTQLWKNTQAFFSLWQRRLRRQHTQTTHTNVIDNIAINFNFYCIMKIFFWVKTMDKLVNLVLSYFILSMEKYPEVMLLFEPMNGNLS